MLFFFKNESYHSLWKTKKKFDFLLSAKNQRLFKIKESSINKKIKKEKNKTTILFNEL
jgi:hypothetical protein